MDSLKIFLRRPAGLVGLIFLLIIIAMAFAAPYLFPDDPWDMAGAPFQPPLSEDLPLGSDMLGRNIAAGIAYGARVSLTIGLASTLAAVLIGVIVGAFAGYYGGKVDDALMRITELFQTIPGFILAILLVATLGPSLRHVIFAIAAITDSGKDIALVGVDADLFVTDPTTEDIILTSILKGIKTSVTDVVTAAADGDFSSDAYVGTLENDGVGYAEFHNFASKVSPDLEGELEAIKAGIIDGSIPVASYLG